jgi:hypothetical protein
MIHHLLYRLRLHVAVVDGVDSVGNHEDSAIKEGLLDELLDILFSLNINVGGRLIHDDNLILVEKSSS